MQAEHARKKNTHQCADEHTARIFWLILATPVIKMKYGIHAIQAIDSICSNWVERLVCSSVWMDQIKLARKPSRFAGFFIGKLQANFKASKAAAKNGFTLRKFSTMII